MENPTFEPKQILAVKMLVLGDSREQVAAKFEMSNTSFGRFMQRIYRTAGTRNTLETAVLMALLGVLDVQPDNIRYEWVS